MRHTLYLIGQRLVNENTNETECFIKVGCTSDLVKRFAMYECHTAHITVFDTKQVNKDAFIRERIYNNLFIDSVKGFLTGKKTEWHKVDLDTYMNFKDNGFNAFKHF